MWNRTTTSSSAVGRAFVCARAMHASGRSSRAVPPGFNSAHQLTKPARRPRRRSSHALVLAVCEVRYQMDRTMSSKSTLTRQGVRDLNQYGPRPSKARSEASKPVSADEPDVVPPLSRQRPDADPPAGDGKPALLR